MVKSILALFCKVRDTAKGNGFTRAFHKTIKIHNPFIKENLRMT